MCLITNDKWYALFVATGNEDRVKERLHFSLGTELRAVVPKRRMRERHNGIWMDKIRTLFPGYVLLNGEITGKNYFVIRDIPGVIRLLQDRDGPQVIDENEIAIISRLTIQNEIIGFSKVYMEGNRVRVIDGPLVGLEGYIASIDKRKGRVKVALNLLGEIRTVELSVTMIQSA